MTPQDITSKLEKLMVDSRTTSEVGTVVCVSGVLAIAVAILAMLPGWSDLPLKDKNGGLNPAWSVKVLATLVTIICTVVLVRMIMHSGENQEAAADPELTRQLPFLKDILGNM